MIFEKYFVRNSIYHWFMNEPKTISELMTLAMEEAKKGNINNAIICLNEAIEIEPHDARF